MYRTRTRNLKRGLNGLSVYFRTNYEMLIFIILILVGIITGCLVVRNADEVTTYKINDMVVNYFKLRSESTIYKIFFKSVMSTLCYIIPLYIISTFSFGAVLIPIILVIRGLGLGIVSGYFYSGFGVKGILYCLFLVFPASLIYLFAIVLASKESFRFSVQFFRLLLPQNKGSSQNDCKSMNLRFRELSLRYCVILLIIVAGGLVDSILSAVLSQFFSL